MSTNGVNGTNASNQTPHDNEDPYIDIDDPQLETYFTERDGRRYHAGTSPYPLPLDAREVQRFVTEHNIIRDVLDQNLYIRPDDVRRVLEDGTEKQVVDLATGNGKWMRDLAEQFPHVQFHGLDIVPLSPRQYPHNVFFELDDIGNRGTRNDATVDIVHVRSAFMTTSDYRGIIQEAARILKPGGLFLATEWHQSIYVQPGLHIPDMQAYVPNLCRFYETLHNALRSRNIDATVPAILPDLINGFPDLFNTPVHAEGHFVPIGTWSTREIGRDIGVRMRGVVTRYMESVRHLLVGQLPEDDVDAMIAGCEQEMAREGSGLSLVFKAVCAVRSE
ncbi:S-adenosyl-L-methionine-dependent methyltransferase [Dendrothele bispora CBS 962.96]|uniref:S-adenosyl-L-methionine-dependent methyltransferase n=1 Tax=Dendrothele bispora (strain CBS 962.96) TaxID=1314807 RepID=A0A4S8LYE9_DENBC|nr:S-adenosyl-L-methionine-dependent methyltransferase [Dendrothele bispora CBS 962.96]